MSQMTKIHVALTEQQVRELTAIEALTDRPRTRIVRRAIGEYLERYRKANPDFCPVSPVGESVTERELKPGLKTDIMVIRGVKQEVIVTENGWRMPAAGDWVEEGG